jgi:hypothetical protein
MKILLFEDSKQYEEQILAALNTAVGDDGRAMLFRAGQQEQPCIHERQLEKDIIAASHQDASLIVADCDLSKLELYGGLSEPTVRRVADKLAIPECSYARGESEGRELLSEAELREARIAVSLEGGEALFAKQVVAIARGFRDIYDGLPAAIGAPGRKTPGKVLAYILGRPEYADKISLYASGDQSRLASVFRARGNQDDSKRRLACLFGYWLWDSVLRFPGVLVDNVAASSYLNIREDAFESGDVQTLFAAARYDGPFAGAKGPIWWREVLDDIVARSGAADGRSLAANELTREVPRSECCEDPQVPAGYYCMFSRKPVSLDNSKNGLTWFPRGADLARISKSKYEEVVPWL